MGLGAALLGWWGTHSSGRYDGLDQRTAYGIALPVADQFLAAPYGQVENTLSASGYDRPSLGICEELGATWGRYSLTLSYRRMAAGGYYDGTTVNAFRTSRTNSSIVTDAYTDYQYNLRSVAVYATLSYALLRLGGK